jgi:hypothetical protein
MKDVKSEKSKSFFDLDKNLQKKLLIKVAKEANKKQEELDSTYTKQYGCSV